MLNIILIITTTSMRVTKCLLSVNIEMLLVWIKTIQKW